VQAVLTTVVVLGSIGLTTSKANAFVVNVGGLDYDVTTFSGSYNDNTSQFNLPPVGVMPWWHDRSMALEFATAVAGSLERPNDGVKGPYFAYNIYWADESVVFAYALGTTADPDAIGDAYAIIYSPPDRVYAAAVPYAGLAAAPGPLPALGAATAFGFSRKLRKRIKSSKGASKADTAV